MAFITHRSCLLGSSLLLLVLATGCTQATSTKTTASQPESKQTSRINTVSSTRKKTQPYANWHTVKSVKLPILMYHSIAHGNTLRVPAKQFKAELNYLKQHHYYCLTADETVHVLKTRQVPQKKLVWITLDDGYQDNYTKAWPLLKQTHSHATINFITSFAHKRHHLTLATAKTMKASGVVDFQSHTVHHLDLNRLTYRQQFAEMSGSKTWLDQHLSQHTQVVCYPAGRANAQTSRAAKLAGYQIALSTTPGIATNHSPRYNLPRQRVTPGMSLESFQSLLH
ncbi:Prophage P2a protein 59; extracellular polysaccharide deacetylase, lipid-anchored [Lactobacillus plantarum ZJ316] [Lactiplantibacillus mudanjiangensis]|uniref:polysaccharide deacetylase family protein n=1 Tax=Lactiplantibacillus mudanjiangensis TaxID=1296538 RepID=UPI001015B52D|nr:Prophage P2a protein 59; extracellular polysaccharide deacetylase, lipid-anchored [Lactobacillus plantarum ZJ316] [Lactiplantibacillus mudanjiangensis]